MVLVYPQAIFYTNQAVVEELVLGEILIVLSCHVLMEL